MCNYFVFSLYNLIPCIDDGKISLHHRIDAPDLGPFVDNLSQLKSQSVTFWTVQQWCASRVVCHACKVSTAAQRENGIEHSSKDVGSRFRLVCHATISSMPTDQILSLLVAERDKLNRAIEALQGATQRRGRQPKADATPAAPDKPARKKRTFTAAQRRQQAERMKAFWAAKRKSGPKSQANKKAA
jgi:hypothetical protein